MRERLIAILIAAATSLAAHSEEPKISESLFYKGTINKSPISMMLRIQSNKASGRYIYDKYKIPIILSGEYNLNKITLADHDKERLALSSATGDLVGVWSDGKNSQKIWLTPQSKSYKSIIESVTGSPQEINIKFKGGAIQNIKLLIPEESLVINFEDFNFDGYPDFAVLAAGGITNSSYLYYAYDPKEKNSPPYITA
ncbi:XAC2610-related protein [Pseudomonas sp. PDM19]|uniref:XAC2610-related protein n=1 Tax=Pseudomonas sp. PDM19 TaxID=2769272 RepID=UPI00177CB3E4|nr:hypothetical protein [Pseudomonas sp. PDM19]MBD9631644.1 hypothetical protein [Pseudomonas sp. PDM19]